MEVFDLLKKLDISYDVIHHKRLVSSKDSENEKIDFKGAVCCKNLLVRVQNGASKGKMYLISLSIFKRADLKSISQYLKIGRLTFADEDELYKNLGVKRGEASIFNIILKPDTDVCFLVDSELLNEKLVAFHPNDNSMSVSINPKDIEKIFKHFNCSYMFFNTERK